MARDTTLAYYDRNAPDIAAGYESVDMSRTLEGVSRYLPEGAAVLEIGTGSGRDAAWLLERGFSVTGVDGSRRMIGEAVSRHPELHDRIRHCVLPDLLPFPAERFDGALSLATIMHLPEEAIPPVLREIMRVLRPGGTAALSVSVERSGLNERGEDGRGRHFTVLSVATWQRLLGAAGFEMVRDWANPDATGRPGISWATLIARRPPE